MGILFITAEEEAEGTADASPDDGSRFLYFLNPLLEYVLQSGSGPWLCLSLFCPPVLLLGPSFREGLSVVPVLLSHINMQEGNRVAVDLSVYNKTIYSNNLCDAFSRKKTGVFSENLVQ